MSTATTTGLTVEQFAARPQPADGSTQELVRGVIVTTPPPRFRHGKVQFHIARFLDRFVEPRGLGQIVTETGVITGRNPDTVRGPDVSFWSVARLPLDHEPDGYPDVAPDLCVEILLPYETRRTLQGKLDEYFRCNVRMVLVVDPEDRTLTVYRTPDQGQLLHETALFEGADVLPGLQCRVAELFPTPPVATES